MKHAINQLEIAKDIAKTNEALYRVEGDLVSADRLLREIEDYDSALDRLGDIDDDFNEPLPERTCTFEEGCESCS